MRGGDWDDWSTPDPAPGTGDDGDWTGAGRRPSGRARVIYAVVVGGAMLASIVLCCLAAGQAGQLLWLEVPPP